MPEYRKKPVVIKAVQWHRNGDHHNDRIGEELLDPFGEGTYKRLEGAVVRFYNHPDDSADRECEHCGGKMRNHGWIDTPEGGHIVCPGDWIITGVKGEMYPCKDDIFQATYEAVT
jgi:hypothetical protein